MENDQVSAPQVDVATTSVGPQTPDQPSKLGRRDLLKAGGFGAVAIAAVAHLDPLAARAQRLMSGAAAPAPKGSLIFIPNNPGNYNLPIDVGFHEALVPLGWSFQQLTPTGIQNNASFISLVEEAVQRGPDALAVAYPGGGAAVSQIKQAASSLKFVIVTNQEDEPYTTQAGLSYVGQDVYSAGELAGTQIAKVAVSKGKKGGTIIGGNEAPGGVSILLRYQGATAAIAAFNKTNGTTFKLINMPDFATDPGKGVATYKAEALQLGNNLAGILTLGGDSTSLMPTVGPALGLKPGELAMGGFDTSTAADKACEDNWIQFIIDQQFYSQGSISGWLAWQAIERTQVPPPTVDTGEALVTRQNLAKFTARDTQLAALATKYGYVA